MNVILTKPQTPAPEGWQYEFGLLPVKAYESLSDRYSYANPRVLVSGWRLIREDWAKYASDPAAVRMLPQQAQS